MSSVAAVQLSVIGALIGLAPSAVLGQTLARAPASVPAAAPAAAFTDVASADAAAADAVPDIVVTGSRIARPDFAAPNPITSYGAAAINQSGNTNLTDFLLRIPALSGSLDRSQTAGFNALNRNAFGGAGLNELNLRNLGTNRTLVLVDGRRHVAGEFNTAAVDIGSIPTDLVQRVDVLTGGASAVYGADGVSGVVNFILRRDLDGVLARAQLGISENGDGANRFASLALGHNFADGRGNITLAYEFNNDDALRNDDRQYLTRPFRQYIVSNTANPGGTNPKLPANILVGDLRYAGESFNGAVDINGDGVPDFDGNGQPYNPGQPISFYAVGGSSTPVAGFVGDLLPASRRHAVNLLTHFDFSDAFKLSFEGKFVESHARTSDLFTAELPATIAAGNPFIPASIRPFVTPAGLTITRDNADFPRHGEDDRRRTLRGVVDVSGRINSHASYDIYYEYGRTETRITKLGDRLNDRMLAALDVVTDPRTGQPVCRSSIDPTAATATGAVTFTPGPNSACSPLNLFGFGSPSRAALGFVVFNDISTTTITQQVANASLNGDFGALFKLPGGPVAFSIGGEYRRETSRFNPNAALVAGQFYQFDEPTPVIASRGSFDVKEAFAELNAPVLSGVPFAETLSVGAAARYSSYSTIGSTTAWRFDGVYAPIRDISIRGSYSTSVRAPNIGELFAPLSASQNFFNDPCDPTNLANGTSFRAGNCSALLRGLGVDLATFSPLTNNISASTVFGTVSGNPNLASETARTWTAGVVLRPRFLPGFTAAIDWYDINLRGAINVSGAQQLAELCVDQPTTTNVFCQSIRRARGTGFINGYAVQPQNVARFRTAGADLNLDYIIRTDKAGDFDLRFVGGYLNRSEQIGTPGAAVENDVDQPNRPRFQFTLSPTWTVGGFTLAYNLRWNDATRRFTKATTDGTPNYAPANLLRYSEVWQHDVQIEYRLPQGLALYAGVNNLTNQRPDPDATNLPVSPLGRFLYVGAKLKLDRDR